MEVINTPKTIAIATTITFLVIPGNSHTIKGIDKPNQWNWVETSKTETCHLGKFHQIESNYKQ